MGIFDDLKGAFRKEESNADAKYPGRNDDCWCGSGKKYKKCHLEEDEKKRSSQKKGCGST